MLRKQPAGLNYGDPAVVSALTNDEVRRGVLVAQLVPHLVPLEPRQLTISVPVPDTSLDGVEPRRFGLSTDGYRAEHHEQTYNHVLPLA